MSDDELPLVRALKHGENTRNLEVVQESKQKRRLTLLCSAAPIRDSARNIIGGIVAWRDITERKQMEEELRKSERRERERAGELAALLDAVPTPVFIAHDSDCQHITGNRAADELLRNPHGGEASLGAPQDTRPHHFRAFKEDRELATEELPAQRAARGERVEGIEFSLVFDDGTVREVVGYGMPLQNANGQPRGSILALVDITERKRAEEGLKKAKEELEVRVQERTEELQKSQQRLQQLASQLIQAQEKERKRIAVELHDSLLSELAAMKYLFEGKLMLLRKGQLADTSEFNKVTDIMQKVMKDARGIMNNLRPSILYEMGLVPTIGWFTKEYQKTYGHIQIRKQVEAVEKDIPDVLKVVMFRVLQEALNNFARHGRGTLVELSLLKSGDTLQLRIQDNGQGFDVERVQKGLGLESMRERVELSGGEFQIESVIGQGTTIRGIWRL